MDDEQEAGVRSTSTILVVDDHAPNRMLAKAVLEAADYAVITANDGLAALEVFAAHQPDLVLLDLRMPRLNGFETCRRLRQTEAGADVPVLFLTAESESVAHEEALACGADDFLVKPLNRTELLIRVRSLLRIRRLQRELATQYEVVKTQRDALVLAERQKKDLTDLVVHDLKSPLTGVLMNLDHVLTDLEVPDPAREALHDARGAGKTLLRLVLNLLDISRSEDGRLAPALAEVDLLALVHQVRLGLERRARSSGRSVVVECMEPSMPMRADADLLLRLVENLLDNGLKYTPSGTTVTVVVERNDGGARILVKDEGEGIPTEARTRIFEKYGQVGKPAPSQLSRGLGLTFCRCAAEAHGGRIWVEENQPRGSAFIVELPA